MDKVYAVFRCYAFQGSQLMRICRTEERAKEVATELQSKEEQLPEYDDWGLCFGAEHVVAEWSIDG